MNNFIVFKKTYLRVYVMIIFCLILTLLSSCGKGAYQELIPLTFPLEQSLNSEISKLYFVEKNSFFAGEKPERPGCVISIHISIAHESSEDLGSGNLNDKEEILKNIIDE